MRKIITFLALLMLHTAVLGQNEKKYSLSVGVTSDLDVIGPNLQFNYALKEKWALNMQTFYLVDMKSEPYSFELSDMNRKYFVKSSDNNNNIFGFNMQMQRFMIGNSNIDTKFSLYGGIGLGFLSRKYKYTNEVELPTNDSLYYYYESEYKYNTVVASLNLGTDLKIGPGKIFFEIPLYYHLFQNYNYKFLNSKGRLSSNDQSYSSSELVVKYFDVSLFLNLGYKIYF